MVYITRRERFSAAHRLFREDWSETQNFEVFGKCSNPNWHGHNYELFVTVKGEIHPETGFVVNLSELSKLIHDLVILKMDHKNLNLEVAFLSDQIISTENIAVAIWKQISGPIEEIGAHLHCVKLVETENNIAEYYGN